MTITTTRSPGAGAGATDELGNPMSGSRDAAALYSQAIEQLVRFGMEAPALAGQLATEHADAPMGQALMAYLYLIGTEDGGTGPAQLHADAMAALPMTTREQGHHQAISAWLAGDWRGASKRLDQIVEQWPADLLALAIGHQLDFFLGDQVNLRDRVARSLFELDPAHPTTALVKGMYAFGLEEMGDLSRAEQVGREAIAVNPADVWAIHAVTHVFEMRGRAEDGVRFLLERKADWAAGNLFTVHNWWHLALFQLEAGNVDEVLEVFDAEVHHAQSEGVALEMVDASALLWRLHLDGHDTGSRFAAVSDAWQPIADARPWYAFNDLHAAMAHVGAGRTAEAEQLVERLSSYVHGNGGGTNVAMTEEVGLPATRAVVRFGQGRYDDVVDELLPIRKVLQRFGGSHAQRDVLQRTLLESAIRSGRTDLARALTSERLTATATSVYGWRQRARVMEAVGRADAATEAGQTADRRQAVVQAAALEAGLQQGA